MATKRTNIYIPQIPRFEIKLFGDWEKASSLVGGMYSSVLTGYDKGIKSFSRTFLRLIKHHIATGTPPAGVRWAPLSPYSYFSTKSQYPDRHLYYMSGLYYRSVGVFNFRGRTYIGLPSKVRYKNGATLVEVARWLEFGTGGFGNHNEEYESMSNNEGIPPRPLWAPTFNNEAGGITKLKSVLLKNIRSQLIRDHGLRANQVRLK